MPPKIKISPSLLAADFANLGESIRAVESAGADELHFDVMDGSFVPNITIGVPVLEAIRPITKLPIDVHMMVVEPARFAQQFADAGADIFTIHAEACDDLETSLDDARIAGMTAAVSLKPDTPVSVLQPVLPLIDRVLVMTVEPGFGGQSFMPEVEAKVRALRQAIDSQISAGGRQCKLMIDGGIKSHNIALVRDWGIEVSVVGSGLINDTGTIAENLAEFDAALSE